jgi:hypothetical protein
LPKVWGAPLVLATLSLIGLITVLVGDGIWDGLYSLALPAFYRKKPAFRDEFYRETPE